MLQPQYIDRCSQPDRLSWQGVIDALIAGHQLPRAAITDTVLADGTNRLLNRSARIEGLGYAVKNVTVFPDNPAREPFLPSVQGVCTVFDECTGQARALIDSELLTYWKTAADSVLGAKLLGPAEPEHLLIFGAGQVACSLIDAYTTIFPSIATVTLCVRRLQSADCLRQKLAADENRPSFCPQGFHGAVCCGSACRYCGYGHYFRDTCTAAKLAYGWRSCGSGRRLHGQHAGS